MIGIFLRAFRRERFESLYRRAMMNAVVDSSFDGIAIADRDGRIELLNPAAAHIVGRAERTLVGREIRSVLPSSPEIEALYETDEHGGKRASLAGPLEFLLGDGDDAKTIEMVVSSARLALNRSPSGGGADEQIVYIYTFRDITDRKRAEDAQKRATDEANAANRAKTEFLANMSHELRTPLNAIIGFSDIIKNEMMGPVGAAQYLEYISDIHSSGHHLLEVVNDILDMSKIECGEMKMMEGTVQVPHVVESSTRLVAERAKTAELDLRRDLQPGLPPLMGDDRMIKQMLLNLLSNAIKFTPAGGTITVGAWVVGGGDMILQVADTGVGIRTEDLERIMEPFGQADTSLAREYEGTGLGLPLVKSMVEMHQGTIAVKSEVGVGTTVTLRFPARRVGEFPAVADEAGEEVAVVA